MIDRASAIVSGSAHGFAAGPPGADQAKAEEFRAVAQAQPVKGQPYIRGEDKKYTEAEIRQDWGANESVAKRLAERTRGDKDIQVIHVIETAAHYGPPGYVSFTAEEIVRRLNRATSSDLDDLMGRAKSVMIRHYRDGDRRFDYDSLVNFTKYVLNKYFERRR
jgi:hypothetical protein